MNLWATSRGGGGEGGVTCGRTYTPMVEQTRGPWALTLCLRTNLAIGQSSRSYTYTAFLPQGSNLSLFSLYEQQFPRYVAIFKIAIFGHEIWPSAKVPEIAHIASFYPKIELIFAPRAAIPRYRLIFKIAILGHKTWQVAKAPEVAHIPSSYPRGVEIELIFPQRAAFSEIWADFQN